MRRLDRRELLCLGSALFCLGLAGCESVDDGTTTDRRSTTTTPIRTVDPGPTTGQPATSGFGTGGFGEGEFGDRS